MDKHPVSPEIVPSPEEINAERQLCNVASNVTEAAPFFTQEVLNKAVHLITTSIHTKNLQVEDFTNTNSVPNIVANYHCLTDWRPNLATSHSTTGDKYSATSSEESSRKQQGSEESSEIPTDSVDTNVSSEMKSSPLDDSELEGKSSEIVTQESSQLEADEEIQRTPSHENWLACKPADKWKSISSTRRTNQSPTAKASLENIRCSTLSQSSDSEIQNQNSSDQQWSVEWSENRSGLMVSSVSDNPQSNNCNFKVRSSPKRDEETSQFAKDETLWAKHRGVFFEGNLSRKAPKGLKTFPIQDLGLTLEKNSPLLYAATCNIQANLSPQQERELSRCFKDSKQSTEQCKTMFPKDPPGIAQQQMKDSVVQDNWMSKGRCRPLANENDTNFLSDNSSDGMTFYTVSQSSHHCYEKQERDLVGGERTTQRVSNSSSEIISTSASDGRENCIAEKKTYVKPSKFPKFREGLNKKREVRFASKLAQQTSEPNRKSPNNKQLRAQYSPKVGLIVRDKNPCKKSLAPKSFSYSPKSSSYTDSPKIKLGDRTPRVQSKKKWRVSYGSNRNYIRTLVSNSRSDLEMLCNEHKGDKQPNGGQWVVNYDNTNYIRSQINPEALGKLLEFRSPNRRGNRSVFRQMRVEVN